MNPEVGAEAAASIEFLVSKSRTPQPEPKPLSPCQACTLFKATLSEYMKTYLVNLAKGDINADKSIPTWEAYSVASQNIELGDDNVGMIADPSNNARRVFWETNTQ